MGFEAPGTGNKLDFAGTPYEGLEVTVDSIPLGTALSMATDYDAAVAAYAAGNVGAALPVIDRLLRQFGEALEEWNVTRRGQPVPPTHEGLMSLDSAFVMAVIGAWLTGTVGVDEELGKGSASGGTSPEELAATAALSSSPLSSPEQKF